MCFRTVSSFKVSNFQNFKFQNYRCSWNCVDRCFHRKHREPPVGSSQQMLTDITVYPQRHPGGTSWHHLSALICEVGLVAPSLFVKGIRTCHFKICHFGLLIVLSWGQLRNSKYEKSPLLPPSYHTAGHALSPSAVAKWDPQPLSPGGEQAPSVISHFQEDKQHLKSLTFV